MDANHFDALIKRLSGRGTRRSALGAVVVGTLGLLGLSESQAAKHSKRPRRAGHGQGRLQEQRRKKGKHKKGKSDKGRVVPSPQPTGVAHWWAVPPEGRIVAVVDLTSPEWREPIKDAVARWNEQLATIEGARVPRLVLEYRDAGLQGTSPVQLAQEEHAIVIVSPDLDASWHGFTEPLNVGAMAGAVTIFDNHDYLDPSTGDPIMLYPHVVMRRDLACHELGHALGATHSPAGTGCGCMAEDRLYCTDALGQDGVSEWTLQELQTTYEEAQTGELAQSSSGQVVNRSHRGT